MDSCGGASMETLTNLIMIPLFYLTVQAHTSMLPQYTQTQQTRVQRTSSSFFFVSSSHCISLRVHWNSGNILKKQHRASSWLLPGEWFPMGPHSHNILIKEYVCVCVSDFFPLISLGSHPHCRSLILLTSGSIFSLIYLFIFLFFSAAVFPHCFARSHVFNLESCKQFRRHDSSVLPGFPQHWRIRKWDSISTLSRAPVLHPLSLDFLF